MFPAVLAFHVAEKETPTVHKALVARGDRAAKTPAQSAQPGNDRVRLICVGKSHLVGGPDLIYRPLRKDDHTSAELMLPTLVAVRGNLENAPDHDHREAGKPKETAKSNAHHERDHLIRE